MKITACIFDMDGLLIDSERIALNVYRDNCEHYQCDHLLPLFDQLLGTNRKTTHQVLTASLPSSINVDEFIERWTVSYRELTAACVPIKSGIVELLSFLEEANIPKAVATSTQTKNAIVKLEKSGIAHRFPIIIGGEQVTHGKPAPDIYLKAAHALDIDPQVCLALEDSPNGVRAATQANMHVIQIPDTVQPDAQMKAMGHLIVEDAFEVITLLKSHI